VAGRAAGTRTQRHGAPLIGMAAPGVEPVTSSSRPFVILPGRAETVGGFGMRTPEEDAAVTASKLASVMRAISFRGRGFSDRTVQACWIMASTSRSLCCSWSHRSSSRFPESARPRSPRSSATARGSADDRSSSSEALRQENQPRASPAAAHAPQVAR